MLHGSNFLPFTAEHLQKALPLVFAQRFKLELREYSPQQPSKNLTQRLPFYADVHIQRLLYSVVIEGLTHRQRAFHQEADGDEMALCVKGYAGSINSYLQDAYDLIHQRSFQAEALYWIEQHPLPLSSADHASV